MLPEEVHRSISSISESELEKLYQQFCDRNGPDKDSDFISELYKNNRINKDELESYQLLKKIELTEFVNVSSEDDATSAQSSSKNNNSQEDFTIMESIDEGGMAEILIAKDNELGRTVAYKKIHPHVAKTPNYLERFFKEAQVTAQLQHPNIVPVYEMKNNGKESGYSMKLIQGRTLQALITESQNQLDEKGKLDEQHDLPVRLEHFLKVCNAMHYAHRKGVIHRDLKPLNIMVGPYHEVYVMDWGIAKIISEDDEVLDDLTEQVGSTSNDKQDETKVGQIMGTPAYMSPEQANGENNIIDRRCDLFSLGLILFELITLRRAYIPDEKETTLDKAKLAKIAKAEPYSRHQNISKQLIAIVNKATRLNPEDRYSTVEEFADDIRRYINGAAIKAKRDTLMQKLLRLMNQHRLAVLNIVLYTILLSSIAVGWSVYQQQRTSMAAQLEGQRMSHFISQVAKQAQYIDAQFLKYEGIVQGVATSAMSLLERGVPDTSPFYDHKDFEDPERAPPDLAESSVYGFPVSIGWHAFKLAPGVEYEQVENLVRIINPLRHTFKQMILKSYHTAIAVDDYEAASRAIKDEGLPLVWTYIGLEEGVFAEYPGKSGYPADFDPRKRPWYINTLKNNGACWMPPYIDVGGRGLMLPCTNKLFDTEGKLLGVAVVEMTLDYIRHKLMEIPNIQGIENTYLLNDRGEIVVDSSDTSNTYERGTLINAMDNLKAYPNKQVVNDILQGKNGYISYEEQGNEKLLTYYKLNSIGWYYLAVANASKVLDLKVN